jgi:hypothetical protein
MSVEACSRHLRRITLSNQLSIERRERAQTAIAAEGIEYAARPDFDLRQILARKPESR